MTFTLDQQFKGFEEIDKIRSSVQVARVLRKSQIFDQQSRGFKEGNL